MEIEPPSLIDDHPDRQLLCEARLEPEFAKLEQTAISAGWSRDEVVIALMDLAKNRILSLAHDRRPSAYAMATERLGRIAK